MIIFFFPYIYPTKYSVGRIQEILAGLHEKINMDLVYLEDQKSGTRVPGQWPDHRTSCSTHNPYTHTSSYLFLWMLIIETVRHCTAEVSRAGWVRCGRIRSLRQSDRQSDTAQLRWAVAGWVRCGGGM